MTPFDLRCEIEAAIKSIPGLKIKGAGSMMVEPYTADISVMIKRQNPPASDGDFVIRIDLAKWKSAQSVPKPDKQ